MTVAYHFAGRVALVTGGSHGIGSAVVAALADAGARVHFTYHTRSEEARARARREAPHPLTAHALDVRDPDAVDRLVREIAAREGRLDCLVNNAGVSRDLLLGEMADEDFDTVVDTNLLGSFHVIRAACRPMLRQRAGAIVNVSSVAGERPEAGQSNYAASKSGVNGLTRALAIELGPRGVRVNAVAPGIIPTTDQLTSKNARLLDGGVLDRIPLRRFGTLAEVAAAVLWLLSDAASYVTGTILQVGGGYRL
ncbi:MAG TPA: 3-oxoacyl-ACP reductase FabG [Candidatus Binatia bacterium]|nr:3-oxoacyl-ACP reductase FabG [Candidatus Binatia bacterium]